MGIFDRVLRIKNYSAATGWPSTAGAGVLSTPFPVGTGLAPVLFPDHDVESVSRAMAMSVPPLLRGLALYATTCAKLRLVAEDGGDAPRWMNHTFDSETPAHRISDMVQDLILNGKTCLMVERDGAGQILDAIRLPDGVWNVEDDGRIKVGEEVPTDQTQFVYVRSLLPQGLLTYAADTILEFRAIRRTIRSRADNPVPIINLQVTDMNLEQEELEEARDNWSKARQAKNGAVALTPNGIDVKPITPPASDDALLIGARNAVRLDVANFLNINASLLEGANGDSSTYENTLQNRNELLELSLDTWLTPIAARLSQPDVSPFPVRFDTSAFDTATDARGNVGTAVQTEPAQEATA